MTYRYAAAPLIAVLLVVGTAAKSQIPQYRWLTAGELETLLRGSRIIETNKKTRPGWQRAPEDFRKDGSYVRYEDNYEANGKYHFRDDAVCDHAFGEREVCRKILLDKEGQYWIVSRANPAFLKKISIEALR